MKKELLHRRRRSSQVVYNNNTFPWSEGLSGQKRSGFWLIDWLALFPSTLPLLRSVDRMLVISCSSRSLRLAEVNICRKYDIFSPPPFPKIIFFSLGTQWKFLLISHFSTASPLNSHFFLTNHQIFFHTNHNSHFWQWKIYTPSFWLVIIGIEGIGDQQTGSRDFVNVTAV